jgi:hypothetical protein
MQAPKAGDIVIHDYKYAPIDRKLDFYFAGVSRVRIGAQITRNLPEKLGVWSFAQEVYRIELEAFSWLPRPILIEEFTTKYAEEIAEDLLGGYSQNYPFCIHPKNGRNIRHVQGAYLTVPSAKLYDLIVEEFGSDGGEILEDGAGLASEEKRGAREGAAMVREITYFARNRALAERVKRERSYTCQVCGFSPRREFGEAYAQTSLDCHHHDPIAVVRKERLTNDSDVSVVCANCHRLLHVRRPLPLTVAEAQEIRTRRSS